MRVDVIGTVPFGDEHRAAFLRGEGSAPFLGLDELSHYVKTHRLYPADGQAVSADANGVRALMASRSVAEVNARLNNLALLVQTSDDNALVLEKLSNEVSASTDPYELDRMAGMFMTRRDILRRLAANPNLPEITQENVLRWSEGDREVMRRLAINPALTPKVAAQIIDHPQRDAFAAQSVAEQAAQRARLERGKGGFTDLCKQLSRFQDSALAATAISGVMDPDFLRQIVKGMTSLLSPNEISAVAGNIHTPKDVLQHLAKHLLPDAIVPRHVKVARQTLSRLESLESSPAPDVV